MSNKTIDYDHVSSVYDLVRSGDPEMVHQLLTGITPHQNLRVLDVGCGTANNTLLFAKASKTQVTGLDFSHGMLREACKKAVGLSFVQAPADSVPFPDASFDFVFMTEVVHHLPDVPSAINEMFRILDETGTVCIVTQSHPQIASRMTSRFFPATIPIDQARYPSIPELEKHILDAGFSRFNPQSYTFAPVRLGAEYLQTVERRGYSMLHKISDEEYKLGLSELRKTMTSGEPLDYSAGYTFVWAFK
ncbi:MAG: class I SAM-dependent methyltransferase [Candidatus Thorarchaeota archaeon]|jgi:SAM-dependent methyltransferase